MKVDELKTWLPWGTILKLLQMKKSLSDTLAEFGTGDSMSKLSQHQPAGTISFNRFRAWIKVPKSVTG